jgi:hypothetical protein
LVNFAEASIAVYYQNQVKTLNALYGQTQELLMIQVEVHVVTTKL